MRWIWLLLALFLVGCGGGSSDEPMMGAGDEPDGVIVGGVANSSGSASGDEATGVYRTPSATESTLAPPYQLAALAPLPGGILDDAAMVALPGRRALVAGGFRTGNVPGAEAYLYDGGLDTWTTVGPMVAARRNHAMVRLADGRVLVLGGFDAANQALASAEVFDPTTHDFSPVGDMTATRGFHSAVLLDDGRVLVVGGLFGAGADAETYDPVTQVFTALAGSPSVQRAAVKLGDGRVLLAGSTSTTATIFDPVANAFSNLGPMSSPHGNFPTVTLLADGRVLIAGGQGNLFETAATDFFDPATDLFSAGPDMNRNRGAHAALRLPNGDVLMIGGSDNGTVHDGAEFWDADQNVFVDLPSTLPGPRMALVAVPLEN